VLQVVVFIGQVLDKQNIINRLGAGLLSDEYLLLGRKYRLNYHSHFHHEEFKFELSKATLFG